MQHVPVWRDAIAQEARRHREVFSKKYSPLYSTDGMVVGTSRVQGPACSGFWRLPFFGSV